MATNNPPSFRYPLRIPAGTHPDIAETLQNHDDAITDLQQAIPELKSQITAATASAANTTTNTTSGSETVVVGANSIGTVNNQTGNVTYATQPLDYGSFIILNDASAIAVTLSTGVTFTLPFFCTFINIGTGVATLTPESGTINGGASFSIGNNGSGTVSFDGVNFWVDPELPGPQDTPAILHEWLKSYNAALGTFTQTQPAFTDISGIATTAQIGTGTPAAGKYVDGAAGAWTTLPVVPATIAPVTGEYLTGYNAGTGLFSASATAGISVTIITAALTVGGTQGSQTFVGGILTSQVQAT